MRQAEMLSLCMIVRNEEANLPSCLASVQTVVDEQVVVDTGSSDRTCAIAKSFGAIIYQFTWCDDFSIARNYSLQLAQGDWVLVLDADEVLLPEAVPLLRQAIAIPDLLAVTLLRQELGAAQAPYSLISRLFRRHPAIAFSRPYHELIDDSVTEILRREPHWTIAELPGVAIRHTGYLPEAIATRNKGDRARRIMESYLAAHPDDAYICNKLGALYVAQGEGAIGLALLERGLQCAGVDAPLRYELHYHLAIAQAQMQQFEQADFHYQQAVQQPVSPRLQVAALNNWGDLRMQLGDFESARVLFTETVERDPTFAIGHFNLGKALKDLGLPGAIEQYQRAIQLDPTHAHAYQNLGVALYQNYQTAASRQAFQQAIALHEQQGSPEADRLRQTLQSLGLLESRDRST